MAEKEKNNKTPSKDSWQDRAEKIDPRTKKAAQDIITELLEEAKRGNGQRP